MPEQSGLMTGPEGIQRVPARVRNGRRPNLRRRHLMSLWLLVLIIVLIVLFAGGFGYSRR